MTLDELQKIEQDAKDLEYKADTAKRSHETFAKLRTDGKSLYEEIAHGGALRYREDDRAFIQGVLNELGPEILRIAELRKAAYERGCRAKARAMRASLNAFLGTSEPA